MKKGLGIILVALLLAGCAAMKDMKTVMDSMKGKKIDVALSALGYPDSSYKVADDTVYVWASHSTVSTVVPQTYTTTGYVGNIPVSTTQTVYQNQTSNLHCTVKVVADSANRIKTWSTAGDFGECFNYAAKVQKWGKAHNLLPKDQPEPSPMQ